MVERHAASRRRGRDAFRAEPDPLKAGSTDGAAGAAARVKRLLYVLPRALKDDGADLAELAAELGVSNNTLAADLEDLVARCYDHPAGLGDDVQVSIDGSRLRVFTTGNFRRPVRLTPWEALCLGLGLRLASLSPTLPDDGAREALRVRLEDRLASASTGDLLERFGAPELEDDPRGILGVLLQGSRDGRVCLVTYLKPGAGEPEERRVHPYAVVHAEGHWYVLGHCEAAEATRAFRLDRVCAASLLDEGFEPPEAFDPSEHLWKGRVFHCPDAVHARVRYSRVIARWLAERHEGQWEIDGSFVVRHRVADPRWIVRHVLSYAGEAELVEPQDLRALVRETASRMAGDVRD